MFKTSIFACTVMAATALFAAADSRATPPAEPSEADLRIHLTCSEIALHRLLTFEEARQCGRAFQRVKLSFVPGLDLAQYEALSAADRATVNLTGYRRYVDWSESNSGRIDTLRDAARAVMTLAAD